LLWKLPPESRHFAKHPPSLFLESRFLWVLDITSFSAILRETVEGDFAYAMDGYIPQIEENVPLPANAKEAFPDLSPAEELNARAATIKFISDLTGQPITPSKENIDQATELAKEMVANPKFRPEFSEYPNEVLAMLAGMVAQMNVAIVKDLADLKLYVVNKLVMEAEQAKDSKARITALRNLGEIDGVDAFKKRSEVTITHKSVEEIEKSLKDKLTRLENLIKRNRNGDVTDVKVIETAKNDA